MNGLIVYSCKGDRFLSREMRIEMNLRKCPGFQINLLNNSSLKALSIEQRLRRPLTALKYQALTESSDVRVTIFCPGLSIT